MILRRVCDAIGADRPPCPLAELRAAYEAAVRADLQHEEDCQRLKALMDNEAKKEEARAKAKEALSVEAPDLAILQEAASLCHSASLPVEEWEALEQAIQKETKRQEQRERILRESAEESRRLEQQTREIAEREAREIKDLEDRVANAKRRLLEAEELGFDELTTAGLEQDSESLQEALDNRRSQKQPRRLADTKGSVGVHIRTLEGATNTPPMMALNDHDKPVPTRRPLPVPAPRPSNASSSSTSRAPAENPAPRRRLPPPRSTLIPVGSAGGDVAGRPPPMEAIANQVNTWHEEKKAFTWEHVMEGNMRKSVLLVRVDSVANCPVNSAERGGIGCISLAQQAYSQFSKKFLQEKSTWIEDEHVRDGSSLPVNAQMVEIGNSLKVAGKGGNIQSRTQAIGLAVAVASAVERPQAYDSLLAHSGRGEARECFQALVEHAQASKPDVQGRPSKKQRLR
jgi:chemotaxis protein histidine kinase CheA